MTEIDLDGIREKYEKERAKRASRDRDKTLELSGSLARYVQDPRVPPSPRPSVEDTVDAVVIGGGFGGLLCGAKLKDKPLNRVRIIDQAGDFGGVWYWNRYPGAQCDIESYIYMPLLEELGTIPTEKYAHAPEIFAHAKAIGRHYGLYDLALFQTTVTGATWDAGRAMWEVTTDRGDRISTRYLIVAIGSLDKLKLPAIPGAETFAGHSFHTSRWDYSYTGGETTGELTGLRDKRVGIVGTGATALQCIPHLGEWSKHLYVFQRTPSTVGVRANRPTDPKWAAALEPGWQERRMWNFTTIQAGGHSDVDLVDDGFSRLYKALLHPAPPGGGADISAAELAERADLEMMDRIRTRIDSAVADADTAAALKPYYRYMCKRPGFHDGYLETFNRPNVDLVDTKGIGIERIVPEGVVVNGRTYHLDCLVWATGFEWNSAYTSRIGFDIHGLDGVSLAHKWRDGLRTLHGMTTSGFPNFLVVPGPNSQSVVTTNFAHALQESASHISYIIQAIEELGAKGFVISDEAEHDWISTILERAKHNEAFQRGCTPGRFNNEGDPDSRPRANTNFGDGPIVFFDLLAKWRSEDQLRGFDLIR